MASRICEAEGCRMPRVGYGRLCRNHKGRWYRHGSYNQPSITVSMLRPYIKEVQEFLDTRPPENGYEPLTLLWRTLVETAQMELRRTIYNRYERGAYKEILAVAEDDTLAEGDTILTILGMWALHISEPRKFPTLDGWLVQLARRVRSLTDAHVGFSYNPTTGKETRTYRSVSRRQLVAMGKALNNALGTACVVIVEKMKQEEEERYQRRQDALRALRGEARA